MRRLPAYASGVVALVAFFGLLGMGGVGGVFSLIGGGVVLIGGLAFVASRAPVGTLPAAEVGTTLFLSGLAALIAGIAGLTVYEIALTSKGALLEVGEGVQRATKGMVLDPSLVVALSSGLFAAAVIAGLRLVLFNRAREARAAWGDKALLEAQEARAEATEAEVREGEQSEAD